MKLLMRIRKIAACGECDHVCGKLAEHENEDGTYDTLDWCEKAKRKVPDERTIPDWCPLEDAPQ